MRRLAALGIFCCAGLTSCGPSGAIGAESSADSLNVYRDAASYQNHGAYDVAAAEWEKFLARFPEDALADKARYFLGVCRLQLGQYESAARALETAAKDASFERAEDAGLYLGWCWYRMAEQGRPELYARAAETLAAMVQRFPEGAGKRTDEGLYYLGEALYAQGRKEEAAKAYSRLIQRFPQSPLRREGLYAWGVALQELQRYDEAGQAYDSVLHEGDQDELAVEVRMRKAETVLQSALIQEQEEQEGAAGERDEGAEHGEEEKASRAEAVRRRYAEAEKLFAEAAEAPGFPQADRALGRQAYCALRQGRLVDAAKLYADAAARFPESALRQEHLLSSGRCYYRAEQWSEAERQLRQALAAGGAGAAEAAHWLCRIQLQSGRAEEARQLAERALAQLRDGGPFLVPLKMDQADALLSLPGRRKEAIDCYDRIAAEHPKDEQAPQALYNAALAAMREKQFAEGLRRAARFLAEYARHDLAPDAQYVAAECRLQLQQYAEAEKDYADLAARFPGRPEADAWRVRIGMTRYLRRDYPGALAALARWAPRIAKRDERAEAQFLIGASQFHQGDLDEAVKALQASLRTDPKRPGADQTLLLLSRAQQAQHRLDDAQQSVRMLIESFPDSRRLDEAYYRLGQYSEAAGRTAEAASAYGRVFRDWPDSTFAPYALYGEGTAMLKTGSYEEAARALTRLIERYPRHELAADARLARAECRRQQGRYEPAIDDLQQLLESDLSSDQRSSALYELTLANAARGRVEAAAKSLDQLLQQDPRFANLDKALYELGWAYKSSGREEAAAAAFRQLATNCPESDLAAEAWFHVGQAEYDKRRYAEAEAAYRESKRRAGGAEFAEKAAYKLGWTLFRLEKYDLALAEFSDQLENRPLGPLAGDGLFMKAECLFQQHRYEEALPAFLAARRAAEASGEADPRREVLTRLHGGQSAAQLKRWDESLSLLAAIPAEHGETPLLAEAYYEMGWAKQNLGRLEEALADYEEAAERSRGEAGARARFMMGEIHFLARRFDEAARQFQRVMYGFGAESAPPEVQKWQVKAAWEAGRCEEAQIADAPDASARASRISRARKCYAYVLLKDPNGDEAGPAQRRLEALAKLKTEEK